MALLYKKFSKDRPLNNESLLRRLTKLWCVIRKKKKTKSHLIFPSAQSPKRNTLHIQNYVLHMHELSKKKKKEWNNLKKKKLYDAKVFLLYIYIYLFSFFYQFFFFLHVGVLVICRTSNHNFTHYRVKKFISNFKSLQVEDGNKDRGLYSGNAWLN